MTKDKRKPAYDLDNVQELVANGKYRANSRPRKFVNEHLGKPSVFIPEIIASISKSDFKKSIELNVLPGTYADVYVSRYEEGDWYVKFYVDEKGNVAVVMSCNWDGAIH